MEMYEYWWIFDLFFNKKIKIYMFVKNVKKWEKKIISMLILSLRKNRRGQETGSGVTCKEAHMPSSYMASFELKRTTSMNTPAI